MSVGDHFDRTKHEVFTDSEMRASAKSIRETIKTIQRLWPERDSFQLMQGMISLYEARTHGYILDISSFAAVMHMPRTSAHRYLNEWENGGHVQLERDGRKTLIHMTPQSLDRLRVLFTETRPSADPA